jgi:hypothetical protein
MVNFHEDTQLNLVQDTQLNSQLNLVHAAQLSKNFWGIFRIFF